MAKYSLFISGLTKNLLWYAFGTLLVAFSAVYSASTEVSVGVIIASTMFFCDEEKFFVINCLLFLNNNF